MSCFRYHPFMFVYFLLLILTLYRNVRFFQSRPKAIMPYHAGYEEDKFLRSLAPLDINEIELLASNCTEVQNS